MDLQRGITNYSAAPDLLDLGQSINEVFSEIHTPTRAREKSLLRFKQKAEIR